MTQVPDPAPRELPIYGTYAEKEDLYTLEFEKAALKAGLRPTQREKRDLGVDVTVEAMFDPGKYGREASGVRALFQLKLAKTGGDGAMRTEVKKTALSYPGRQLGAGFIAGWHEDTGTFHAVAVERAVATLDARMPDWRTQNGDDIDVGLDAVVSAAWLEEVRARLLRMAPLVEAVSGVLSADDGGMRPGSSKTLCSLIGPLNAQLVGDLGRRDDEARADLLAGNAAKAAVALRELLEDIRKSGVKYGREWAVQSNFGLALAALGRHVEAHEQFIAAWTGSPRETATIVNLALSSLNMGKVSRAVELHDSVADRASGEPLITNLAALIASQRGSSDEAVAMLRAGIERHPKALPLYRSLGNELLDRGEIDAAIDVARRGRTFCPDEPGIGWLDFIEGDAALLQAVATVGGARSENLEGELEIAIEVPIGTKFEVSRAKDAAELLRRAISRLPDALRGAQLQLGAALTFAGEPGEAIKVYEQIAADEKYGFRAKAGIAHALVQLGRHADALPVLDELLNIQPRLLGLLNSKAICLAETSRIDEAGDFFRAAAEHPAARDLDLKNYLGWTVQTRAWKAAEDFIRTRIAKEPTATLPRQWLYELGVAKADRGLQVEGVAGFLSIKPDNAFARKDLGYLELKRGNFDAAAAAFDLVDASEMDHHALAAHVAALGHAGRWDDAVRVAQAAWQTSSADDRRRWVVILARTSDHRRITLVTPGGIELPGDLHVGLPFTLTLPPDGPGRRR